MKTCNLTREFYLDINQRLNIIPEEKLCKKCLYDSIIEWSNGNPAADSTDQSQSQTLAAESQFSSIPEDVEIEIAEDSPEKIHENVQLRIPDNISNNKIYTLKLIIHTNNF